MQFVSKITHARIRRFDLKNMCIGNVVLKDPRKLSAMNEINPYIVKRYVFRKQAVKTLEY